MPGFRKVARESSLGFLHPELIAEWDDEADIFTLAARSGYVAQWKCSTDPEHRWAARVTARSGDKTGCPRCPRTPRAFEPLPPELQAQLVHDTDRSVSSRTGTQKEWRCEQGHTWRASPYSRAIQGTGCPYCSNRRVLAGYNDLATTHPDIAAELNDPRYEASQVVAGNNSRASWKCALGHTWTAPIIQRTRPISGRAKATGCPVCSGRETLSGFNDLATTHPLIAAEWADTEKSPREVSYGSAYRALWRCAQGHEWTASVTDRASKGNGCPGCNARRFVSSAEEEIADYVRYLVGAENVRTSVRGIPGVHEIDILVPAMGIGIEYNGVFFHSEAKGRGRGYHSAKVAACRAEGIRLIQVWEDDWRDRRPIIEAMLAHKLGKSSRRRVAARKTRAATVTKDVAEPFFEMNHIQGFTPGTHYLALLESDTPVAMMVLKKTDSSGRVLRLERYATSVTVAGGQSKLIAYAERVLDGWEELLTFADAEVSDGGLYEASGWERDGELAPDYRYAVRGTRVHKFNYRLARFERDASLKYEKGMSESELARLNNLPRVWDSGKVRYLYKRR